MSPAKRRRVVDRINGGSEREQQHAHANAQDGERSSRSEMNGGSGGGNSAARARAPLTQPMGFLGHVDEEADAKAGEHKPKLIIGEVVHDSSAYATDEDSDDDDRDELDVSSDEGSASDAPASRARAGRPMVLRVVLRLEQQHLAGEAQRDYVSRVAEIRQEVAEGRQEEERKRRSRQERAERRAKRRRLNPDAAPTSEFPMSDMTYFRSSVSPARHSVSAKSAASASASASGIELDDDSPMLPLRDLPSDGQSDVGVRHIDLGPRAAYGEVRNMSTTRKRSRPLSPAPDERELALRAFASPHSSSPPLMDESPVGPANDSRQQHPTQRLGNMASSQHLQAQVAHRSSPRDLFTPHPQSEPGLSPAMYTPQRRSNLASPQPRTSPRHSSHEPTLLQPPAPPVHRPASADGYRRPHEQAAEPMRPATVSPRNAPEEEAEEDDEEEGEEDAAAEAPQMKAVASMLHKALQSGGQGSSKDDGSAEMISRIQAALSQYSAEPGSKQAESRSVLKGLLQAIGGKGDSQPSSDTESRPAPAPERVLPRPPQTDSAEDASKMPPPPAAKVEERLPPPKPAGRIHCYHCGREDPGLNGFWRKIEIADDAGPHLPPNLSIRYPGAVKSDSPAGPGAKVFIACSRCGPSYIKWKEENPTLPVVQEPEVAPIPSAEARPAPASIAETRPAPAPKMAQTSPVRPSARAADFALSSPGAARESLFSDVGMDYGDGRNFGMSGTPGTIMNSIQTGWTPLLSRSPLRKSSAGGLPKNPYASISTGSPLTGKRTGRPGVTSSSPVRRQLSSGAEEGLQSSVSRVDSTGKRHSSVTSPLSPSNTPGRTKQAAGQTATTPKRLADTLANWPSSDEEDDRAHDPLIASPSPARRAASKGPRVPSSGDAPVSMTLQKGPRSVGPFMGREASADGEMLAQRALKGKTSLTHDMSSPSRGPTGSKPSGSEMGRLFNSNNTPLELDSSWMDGLQHNPHLYGSPSKFLASIGLAAGSGSGTLQAGPRRPQRPTVEDAASSSAASSPDNHGTPNSLVDAMLSGVNDEHGFLEKLEASGIDLGSNFSLSNIETFGAFDFVPQLHSFTAQNVPGFAAHVPPSSVEPSVIFQGVGPSTEKAAEAPRASIQPIESTQAVAPAAAPAKKKSKSSSSSSKTPLLTLPKVKKKGSKKKDKSKTPTMENFESLLHDAGIDIAKALLRPENQKKLLGK